MQSASIYEAKTRLSALIQAVERGEEAVIADRNRPVARLVPVTLPRERPAFGSAKGASERSGLTREATAKALARDGRERTARVEPRVSRWFADTCALVDFYTADPTLSGSIRNLFLIIGDTHPAPG